MVERRLAERLAALVDPAATPIDQHLVLSESRELSSAADDLVPPVMAQEWVRTLGQRDPSSLWALGTQTDLAAIGDVRAARLLDRAAEIGVGAALVERYGPYQAPV